MEEAELARSVQQLPDRFADRMQPRALAALRSLVGGGEWKEALEALVASLMRSGAAVTEEEKNTLRPMLRRVRLPEESLDRLSPNQQ